MKIDFSREVEYIPEWKGNRELPEDEQFKATLTPLQMADLVGLIEVIQEFGEMGEEGDAINMGMEKAVTVLEKIEHMSDNITLTNLEDKTGVVTSEDMVKFPRFMSLAMELFNELASISMPDEADEKNLSAQPD